MPEIKMVPAQRCQQFASLPRVAINAGGAYNYVPTAIMAILALLPKGAEWICKKFM